VEVERRTGDGGDTVKWLWASGPDGAAVETVLMQYPDGRATVCVSSQAGCAMACSFCATGQAGFERHLDAGEIVEQVARVQHATDRRISNVVFMGMGEPLANVDAVLAAVERLHDDFGISARHLTVSTVGVVPGMRRLAEHPLPVTLAVSIHAPTDELRDQLVPLNRRYPLGEVVAAAREVARRHGRRVTFEYTLLDGVNDGPEHAAALAVLLADALPTGASHVNLIPYNATPGLAARATPAARMERFANTLRHGGVNATVRRNRGTDIDAACGQLRTRVRMGTGRRQGMMSS
jgi:23S rRNA (adenine2503-C2)-methyltransferase